MPYFTSYFCFLNRNGYMTIVNSNVLTKFVSNKTVPSGSIAIGNEYNVLVPANGSTEINFLPDGKYEIICHYDIDFDNFDFTYKNEAGRAIFSEENGKHYVTFSSTEITTTAGLIHMATIDYWRGYVNDKNDVPVYNTSVKKTTDNPNQNGFYANEDSSSSFQDDKYPGYIDNGNYQSGNFQTGN